MQRNIHTISVTGALLAFAAFAPHAHACSTPGIATWRPPMMVPQMLLAPAKPADPTPAGANSSIVGLWFIQFSSGGYIVDQAFDAWHSDGTEILNDFTDPIEDNVCLGVWSQSGQTYKLKHPSWTFDTNGTLTGTAFIGETVTLAGDGNSFSGTYTINLYDITGKPAGQYHGTVSATRVMPD